MKKVKCFLWIVIIASVVFLAGCGKSNDKPSDPNNPVAKPDSVTVEVTINTTNGGIVSMVNFIIILNAEPYPYVNGNRSGPGPVYIFKYPEDKVKDLIGKSCNFAGSLEGTNAQHYTTSFDYADGTHGTNQVLTKGVNKVTIYYKTMH